MEGQKMTVRPSPLAPIFDNIPHTLTAQPCWVLWSYSLKGGKWTKIPKQTGGSNASTTNAATWCTFDVARAAYHPDKFDGVGIVLNGQPLDNGLYLVGLDFDDCLSDGELNDAPRKAIETLYTYFEISPSGKGIRLFLLHDKPTQARKLKVDGKSREVYSWGRYLTVTGHVIGQAKEVRHVA
jgi:primase-polymerase (primpol)-like protein